jgi:hypothetical protein
MMMTRKLFVLQRFVGVKECKNDILNGCLMVYTPGDLTAGNWNSVRDCDSISMN